MIESISDPDDPRLEPYRHIRERDLVGRDGLFVAEGKIVLSILASNDGYDLQSVLILEGKLATNQALLGKIPGTTPVFAVSAAIIDAVAGFQVHRGLLGIGRKIHRPGLADLIRGTSEDCLAVVLSNISNHDNVGAIFRNAAAFSAGCVILDNQCCDPLYRKSLRVSVGGVLTVPWSNKVPVAEIIDTLSANGFFIAALSPSGRRAIGEIPATGRRALLLGSEGHGLPQPLMDRLETFKIPMSASFDSLNVATAAGIALYAASGYAGRA